MQKVVLRIFCLANVIMSIKSLPPYEIQRSIELYSGPFNWDVNENSNDKITVAFVDCDDKKPGRRIGHQRHTSGPWVPPGHKKGYPHGHRQGAEIFPGWGFYYPQQYPHQQYPYQQYPHQQYPHQYHTHPQYPQHHQNSYEFYPHGFPGHHYPNNQFPQKDHEYFNGDTHSNPPNYFHEHHDKHELHQPHDSHDFHSVQDANPPEQIDSQLPEEKKPSPSKCNNKNASECKEDDNTLETKPEVPTPSPMPDCSVGCTSEKPSSLDYPDIDVRFGDEDTTTVGTVATTPTVGTPTTVASST